MAATSQPVYQNVIRDRLMANQEEGERYREVIDQYRRLARTARELKIRNKALLRSGTGPSAGSDGLLNHLESQLTLLRTELSTLYRTQAAAQNKQLQLSDALRDRDEEVRGLREDIRVLREQKEMVGRREEEWGERWRARGRDVETLNDELLSLNLELSTLQQRNAALQTDNAQLLQRWLDRMQESVDGMNEEFERETAVGKADEPVLINTEDITPVAPAISPNETPKVAPVPNTTKAVEGKKVTAPTAQSQGGNARTASGSKVDERRKMFETKLTGPTAVKEGFRIGGKGK